MHVKGQPSLSREASKRKIHCGAWLLLANNKNGVSIKNVLFATLRGDAGVIFQTCFSFKSAGRLSVGTLPLQKQFIDLK